jgi:hypothetical protein
MKPFVVTITMQDGSQGRHVGIYPSGSDAVIAAMSTFPDAKRISARRLP